MLNYTELLEKNEWISLYVLIFFTVVILFNYLWYYSRLAFGSRKEIKPESSAAQPVSVVICARNEYHNLEKNLLIILEQDYPIFEVIVVNDFSEDESYFLLKSLSEKYNYLKVVNLRENVNFFEGKKLALAVGIKSARYETVLLTDADCKPAGKNWIKSMMAAFDEKTEIVLGYGPYRKTRGFLDKLIRFDTLTIAMQYMGYALAGKPYMGVGRNLAYKKDLFFKSGGFSSHYKISSGDDDLFINKAANKRNTRIVTDPESFTFSEPKKTFSEWFKQKKRHLSTGKYYKPGDKFRLGLLALSNTMFYVALIVFLAIAQSSLSLYIALAVFLVKLLTQLLIFYYAGKKLKEAKLFLYSPIFDMIFAFLNPVFAISNLFYRKNKWK